MENRITDKDTIEDIIDTSENENFVVFDCNANRGTITLRLLFLCENIAYKKYDSRFITKIYVEEFVDILELQELMSLSYRYAEKIDDIEIINDNRLRKNFDARQLSINNDDEKIIFIIFNNGALVTGSY